VSLTRNVKSSRQLRLIAQRAFHSIAQRPLPKSHPRNRPSGASSKSERPALPNWLWIVGAFAAGILITSLLKMPSRSNSADVVDKSASTKVIEAPATKSTDKTADNKSNAAKSVDTKSSEIKSSENKSADSKSSDTKSSDTKPADAKPTTKFDFYTLLPEQEVIEPNERPEPAPAAKIEKGQKPQAPAVTNNAAPGEEFILQAGSFHSAQEAERRRAQVQALGLPNRQESVSTGSDTWYRVLVGPFPTRDAVAQARDKLAGQSIETILVRKKTAQ